MMSADDPPVGWITGLLKPEAYAHATAELRLLETHISWVILTGAYAYKIKKPVDLGFLDFSTLERRHFFCEEELRLNRRTAPDLYLDVVPITGSPGRPLVDRTGEAFDYAVRMKQFDADALFSQRALRGQLTPPCIDALATRLASFHRAAPRAASDSPWGSYGAVAHAVDENLSFLSRCCADEHDCGDLTRIRQWTDDHLQSLSALIAERHASGYVRECHGDLHLANLALIDDEPVPFDCIEFNPALRWIDIVSEVAFLTMDLAVHGLEHLAYRFINHYQEAVGDYAGLRLWTFYRCYRALVRAKVTRLMAAPHAPATQATRSAYRQYVDYALALIAPPQPLLLVTHGVAGSGKSTLAAALAERIGAIRLRSDVERKRDIPADTATRADLYAADVTRRTYARLAQLTGELLGAGLSTIVDATFLRAEQRQAFRGLAQGLGVPFRILDVEAPEAILRERVVTRAREAHDPSDATLEVLAQQLLEREPLTADEHALSLPVDGAEPVRGPTLATLCRQLRG